MNFIDELSEIHNKCRKLIEARDHVAFINFAHELLDNNDDEINKLNRLKTLLIISKNVPKFFPEITDIRLEVLKEYDTLFAKLK